MAAARNQSTYDFLTGASSPPRHSLRETLRAPQLVRPNAGNEELRAQINTLQYELDSVKQEREFTALRHQQELREVENKAEADFKRAQTSESASHAASAKYSALAKELQESQDRSANEKLDLERKLRTLQDQNTALQEEVEEAKADLSLQERQSDHKFKDLETRHNTIQTTFEELQADLHAKVTALQTTQSRLSQREAEVGRLESEVLRLKAQTGDADTLAVIKRELSEQVAHIKKLESTNREQLAELKQYRKLHKSIEVVEEEKRVLETRLRMMDDLRRDLGEAQIQRQRLEDERKSWSAYLENQVGMDGELHFESPEAMARAFMQERLERLSLVEKLGAVEPELSVREENVKVLESEKAELLREIEKLRAGGGVGTGDSKLRTRLERQRTLAVKEVEYLRAQLKTFDAEEIEFQPDNFDEQKSKRVQELEDLVDQYRKEVQSLHQALSKVEAPPPVAGTKRERDEHDDERLGELRRKTRALQDDLSKLQTRNASLETELRVRETQLAALQESSRTRILELRSNPTADAEALKLSTLSTLREENKALLAQLEGRPQRTKVVPISTLEAARLTHRELEASLASAEKRMLRLKQIWASKSLEFREAVASILGWKMDFMPAGRFKMTSLLYPHQDGDGDGDEENSIVFDGENGTMKVSGGPQSVFAGEIRGLIEFWVEGRKEIPCFLAACTLEFYERSTRAARM
ncbi:hypothetical protein B0A49_09526 [Cryomyces minteri]|uniref:Spindle assembly checkpoint component MAD1 n=1 Tax=Cryomyces minteri TaxID=331657 RepID=A0A4U0WGG5_9PEZI|nr:hypothetical protein B0A49_09526 [Cryomyces minteri]